MRLKDKIAVVTGSSTGIGRAVAELFAKEGAKILIVDVNEKDGDDAVKTIKENGGEAVFQYTDVTDEKSVQEMAAKTLELYGATNILVNNAGIELVKPIETVSVDEWDKLMSINVRGYFLCIKYILPQMKENGGVIINTSSAGGIAGSPLASLYCSSKGAIVLLTKALSGEFKPYNIRVNCVCPALIRTPLGDRFAQSYEDQGVPFREILKQRQGDPGTPEELAPSYLYLATDDSKLMNGHALVLDGGMSVT